MTWLGRDVGEQPWLCLLREPWFPPAEPTYLQLVEGESTFSTLLSPVLAAELVEQAKAVQTGSLQCVHCLEQLKDGEVSGGSGQRKWGPLRDGDLHPPSWGEDTCSDPATHMAPGMQDPGFTSNTHLQ